MFNRNTINSQGSSMNLEKNSSTGKILELFGPTVEFLTSPLDTQSDFCILRGIIPDGVYVPLHSPSLSCRYRRFFCYLRLIRLLKTRKRGSQMDQSKYGWLHSCSMQCASRMAQYIGFNHNRSHSNDKEDGKIFSRDWKVKEQYLFTSPNTKRSCSFLRNEQKVWILECLSWREWNGWYTYEFLILMYNYLSSSNLIRIVKCIVSLKLTKLGMSIIYQRNFSLRT